MVISRSNLTDGWKNPILAAALKLAELGFYIYPSPKKNGAARVKWRLNSTRYSPTITRWWTQWPRDLICLDCGKSKIAVIDADSIEGHGIDGLTNLLDLELQHSLLPETLKARTPSGGEHSFFRDPEGKMKSTAGVLAPASTMMRRRSKTS
jgi:putative DNA primase/helicase